MEFYAFDLFADNQSKTMMIIIDSINSILNQEFKDYINEDIISILKNVYQELIESVISTESPKFEDSKAVNIFRILFYSFLKRFKSEYGELKKIFEDNKKKFLVIINIIKTQVINKIGKKISEYDVKYKIYQENKKLLEKEIDEKKDNFIKKNSGLFKRLKYKICDINKDFEKTDEFKNWAKKYKYNESEKPYKDWENFKKNEYIIQKLIEIKSSRNFYFIKEVINDHRIDGESEYIEKNNFKYYLDLLSKLNENIDNLKNIQNAHRYNNFSEEEFPPKIKTYEIQELKLSLIHKIIS